jgi:hypothetical protein
MSHMLSTISVTLSTNIVSLYTTMLDGTKSYLDKILKLVAQKLFVGLCTTV